MMMWHVSGKDGTTLCSKVGAPPVNMLPPRLAALECQAQGRSVKCTWELPPKREPGQGRDEATLAEIRLTLKVAPAASPEADADVRTRMILAQAGVEDTDAQLAGARAATFVDVPANACSHDLELPPDAALIQAAGDARGSLMLCVTATSISDKGALGWNEVSGKPWTHALVAVGGGALPPPGGETGPA